MKKLLCIILLFLLLTANVGQAQFNDSEPTFGQQLNLGHWATDSLVFYWRGIEAGNVVDESFNRNHGTITGATWQGEGLFFDGLGDLFTPANSFSLTQFTFIVRFKTNDISATTLAGDSSDDINYMMILNSTTLRFRADIVRNFTIPALSVDEWHTAAYTRDAGNNLRVYWDGIESSTGAISDSVAFSLTTIGKGTTASGEDFDGTMSDVKIYNRALSESEILDLYINPNLPMQQEPIWLMYSPAAPPSGIVPIIQAHTRRRRAG